ncbi:MAG: hypothetical protein Pars92KO_23890 [Parasphingorhabdus sp.]
MAKILVVENERIAARDLSEILTELDHKVVGVAADFEDSLALAIEHQPDLALIDIHIDGKRDGVALAGELREEHSMALAFISSHADHNTVTQASATRPNGYLVKPFDKASVDALVSTALSNFVAERASINQEQLAEAKAASGHCLTQSQSAEITQYIERNMDQAIKVEHLADRLNMGTSMFAKRFQASFGMSPYQYLIEQRLDEAKRLLRNTSWPIAEIALAVGFSNQAHFTTSFRQAVKVTPHSYRNSMR